MTCVNKVNYHNQDTRIDLPLLSGHPDFKNQSSDVEEIQKQGRSVCAIIINHNRYSKLLKEKKDKGVYRLGSAAKTLESRVYKEFSEIALGEKEKFRDQLAPVSGTGFKVDDRLIATAEHVLRDENGKRVDLEKIHIVFGFVIGKDKKVPKEFPKENVYHVKSIRYCKPDSKDKKSFNIEGEDYALLEVDREIEGRASLQLELLENVHSHKEDSLYALGHPQGLPLKYTNEGKVLSPIHSVFFTTRMDLFSGSSGSPIFWRSTHKVVGIVMRGQIDLVKDEDYRGSGKSRIISLKITDKDEGAEYIQRVRRIPLRYIYQEGKSLKEKIIQLIKKNLTQEQLEKIVKIVDHQSTLKTIIRYIAKKKCSIEKYLTVYGSKQNGGKASPSMVMLSIAVDELGLQLETIKATLELASYLSGVNIPIAFFTPDELKDIQKLVQYDIVLSPQKELLEIDPMLRQALRKSSTKKQKKLEKECIRRLHKYFKYNRYTQQKELEVWELHVLNALCSYEILGKDGVSKVLDLAVNLYAFYKGRGDNLDRMFQIKQQIFSQTQSKQINLAKITSHQNLAEIQIEQKKYAEAIKGLAGFINGSPDTPEKLMGYSWSGYAYLKMDNVKKASQLLEHVKKALKDTHFPLVQSTVYYHLGCLDDCRKEYQQALKKYSEGLKVHPTDDLVYGALSTFFKIEKNKRDYKVLWKWLEEGIELSLKNLSSAHPLARIYKGKEKSKDVIDNCRFCAETLLKILKETKKSIPLPLHKTILEIYYLQDGDKEWETIFDYKDAECPATAPKEVRICFLSKCIQVSQECEEWADTEEYCCDLLDLLPDDHESRVFFLKKKFCAWYKMYEEGEGELEEVQECYKNIFNRKDLKIKLVKPQKPYAEFFKQIYSEFTCD